MESKTNQLRIGHTIHEVVTPIGQSLDDTFEPHTVAILEALTEPNAHVLDVGANIGLTALALSKSVPEGRIVAIEPVPANFRLLSINLRHAGALNVTPHNFALGKTPGEVMMQGNPTNATGAFIVDETRNKVTDASHFKEKVAVLRMDDAFSRLGLDRIDMMKLDVEGYELDVLDGASELLGKFKPRVFLEMNHIALNLWHGISLPEFRRRLFSIFPFVYAVGHDGVFDMTDEAQCTRILYAHLKTGSHYNDLVAGFDRTDLEQRLSRINPIIMRNERIAAEERAASELSSVTTERDQALAELERTRFERDQAFAGIDAARSEIEALKSSHSWKATAPLRGIRRLIDQ